ncbi:hypothetical protein WA026_013209 [Henosepilachna vigintioctopunctata]|uniref:Gustatory receptor n=1 Tax=Henosepilachna vigintioctopunctata TaxID=420089 RepID=A0AAW1UJ79_9CUCU
MHKTLTDNFIKPDDSSKQKICLCRSIVLMNTVSAIFGMNSLSSKHVDGMCYFQVSKIRLCWSGFIAIALIFKVYYFSEYEIFTNTLDLPVLLNAITDTVCDSLLMLGLFFNIWKAKQWMKVMNDISKISKYGVLCRSALLTVRNLTWAFTGFIFSMLIFNSAILAYLHFSETYENELQISFIMRKILQNGVLYYYVVVFATIALQMGLLTCFEKISQHALNYTEIYPMHKISESNNQQDIFIFFTYNVCNSKHVSNPELQKLPNAEIIEHFRILHEEISEIMYELNNCFNPSLLSNVVIEIIMLVVNWYSVIIKIVYDFHFFGANTIFLLNILFAVSHTIGLFVFLRNAQKLSNMVHGYNSFLMEYSTRVSTPAEHLQLRVFIEKIKQHKPITASGIFTVDLGIAGPIFANILTYVLVALQFKIPQASEVE